MAADSLYGWLGDIFITILRAEGITADATFLPFADLLRPRCSNVFYFNYTIWTLLQEVIQKYLRVLEPNNDIGKDDHEEMELHRQYLHTYQPLSTSRETLTNNVNLCVGVIKTIPRWLIDGI
jgi:hypothetical protein